eukprot:CAMPEP_0172396138 /NCGR_PEP_ID=MMETSP1061-20121228/23810_1 /TAXON_ID=37318 /ORGANISM="Pseudo-nitzschia pungens, Strain cf. pungens" /LENGTH=267 /DNA_ID=CAMNT_0013127923 /DNA_START=480 /DNA_END=1283 /DNA_ORIENTATION=-
MSSSASTSDNTFRCQITRSERPCLVCSGHMDLVEARPRKLNFFGGIPLVCSSEGVDCLDCPRCGFKTTTTDYEYLKMCKRTRQVRGMFHGSEHRRISKEGSHSHSQSNSSRSRKRNSRSRRNESFATSHSGSERICSGCQVALESNEWQFCPKCGSKCRAETHVLSSSSMSSGCDVSNDIIEITIPKNVSNDRMIADDDNNIEIPNNSSSSNNNNNISDSNISDANSITETNTSPSQESSGISRMVTPPKRSKVLDCSMEGPVEMQY